MIYYKAALVWMTIGMLSYLLSPRKTRLMRKLSEKEHGSPLDERLLITSHLLLGPVAALCHVKTWVYYKLNIKRHKDY